MIRAESPPDRPEYDPDRATNVDLACEIVLRYLAGVLAHPRSESWQRLVLDKPSQMLALEACDQLREALADVRPSLGFGELPAESLDLRPLLAELTASPELVVEEFHRVFGLVQCRECPPYETEFQPNDDTFFRSQQMADIAGFYRAFGVRQGEGGHERPDHLSLELEFAALLLMRERLARQSNLEHGERSAICRDALTAFVRDHLAWWAPSFSLALRHKAESGVYECAGRLISALMPILRGRLGIAPPALPILRPTNTESADACEGCAAGSLR